MAESIGGGAVIKLGVDASGVKPGLGTAEKDFSGFVGKMEKGFFAGMGLKGGANLLGMAGAGLSIGKLTGGIFEKSGITEDVKGFFATWTEGLGLMLKDTSLAKFVHETTRLFKKAAGVPREASAEWKAFFQGLASNAQTTVDKLARLKGGTASGEEEALRSRYRREIGGAPTRQAREQAKWMLETNLALLAVEKKKTAEAEGRKAAAAGLAGIDTEREGIDWELAHGRERPEWMKDRDRIKREMFEKRVPLDQINAFVGRANRRGALLNAAIEAKKGRVEIDSLKQSVAELKFELGEGPDPKVLKGVKAGGENAHAELTTLSRELKDLKAVKEFRELIERDNPFAHYAKDLGRLEAIRGKLNPGEFEQGKKAILDSVFGTEMGVVKEALAKSKGKAAELKLFMERYEDMASQRLISKDQLEAVRKKAHQDIFGKPETFGSFNAEQFARMGATGTVDKIKIATQQTAENTKEIRKATFDAAQAMSEISELVPREEGIFNALAREVNRSRPVRRLPGPPPTLLKLFVPNLLPTSDAASRALGKIIENTGEIERNTRGLRLGSATPAWGN